MADTPAYRITVDGGDYTDRFQGRLIDLSIRDRRGLEADSLSLALDDSDGLLELPRSGALIGIQIGWADQLWHMGYYTVDDVTHDGPPDALRIEARSADFRESLKVAKERSWHDETLGNIVNWIAGDHTLAPAVSPDLAYTRVGHLDQTNESDAHFLTRLAERYDAIATVKAERLIFVKKGRGLSATGRAIPPVAIRRSDGDRHSYQAADRDSNYSGVTAYWDDKDHARRSDVSAGSSGNRKVLRTPYPTADEAADAAEAEWRRIRRAVARMDLTLAKGRPDLITEQPVTLDGWKPAITAHDWLTAEITHRLDGNGYTTALQLEVRVP